MSFLDIKNPSERDAIVKEYLAIIKRIQQKNLNEKAHDLVRSEDIERTLEPVVRTTKQSTEAITKELLPIKNEIKVLNKRLENRENKLQKGKEKEKEGEKGEEPAQDHDVVQMFYNRVSEEKLDKYFGIVMENGRYKMGNKYVHLDGIDLIVDHKRYVGTKGFWSLIMVARPENYTREDFVKYRDLIAHTNAMAYPNNVTTSSRLKSTKKWRSIFPLFDHLDDDDDNESLFKDRNRESLEREKETSPRSHGDSIQFLPASIKGMETKLNYLLGEYRAGNTTSTRNEIVSILDELLRRKGISRKEYKDINNFLQ